MGRPLILLSLLSLVVVNMWHTILLARRSKDRRSHTISQHAVDTPQSLLIHKIVHIAASVILIIFGSWYLLLHNYLWAGWLIIIGAIFDILEVITLNKKTASEILAVNYHVVAAWVMAMCYLLYASVIIAISGLSSLLIIVIWALFAVLLVVSIYSKFKNFWITQHLYFCFLACMIVASHVTLLVR